MRSHRLYAPIPTWPDREGATPSFPHWSPALWVQIERHPSWTAEQHLQLLHLLGTYGPTLEQVQELVTAFHACIP